MRRVPSAPRRHTHRTAPHANAVPASLPSRRNLRLAPQDAELVALRIREHDPPGAVVVATVGYLGRPQREQTRELLVPRGILMRPYAPGNPPSRGVEPNESE